MTSASKRDDAIAMLEAVEDALDELIATSHSHDGLVPSLINRDTGEMLETLPEPIPGQRNSDRAHLGTNLVHDEPLLRTLYGLGRSRRPAYTTVADRYLDRWVDMCTDTPTGLFPWGEHAYWRLDEPRIGNSYRIDDPERDQPVHDHLRKTPRWLWEAIHDRDPAAVHRFAEGIRYHWNRPEAPEYIRHAYISERGRYPVGERSCDFPRHGGHYIYDWTFAHTRDPHAEYVRQIRNMLDYWWERRFESDMLPLESRGHNDEPSHKQTTALATSLREAADLLDEHRMEPELAETMRARADTYFEALLETQHDCEIWGSEYGDWPASYIGVMFTCAWRHGGDDELLDRAKRIAQAYLDEPLPDDTPVPAMDAGLAVDLIADLVDITTEDRWSNDGLRLAEDVVTAYLDKPIPRGATGIDRYESQMGPGFVLHGVAHLAMRVRLGSECPLTTDYTPR